TTHYSIIDRWGNAAAVTTTLNDSFGSKVIVKGAGFLLNDEMDDFSVKPGVPNMYGMVGGEANAIEPGKRMLSSMTPTLLEKEGKLFMIVGTPGGSTIITTVFQMVLNVTEHGMNIRQAVNAGRVHSQWLPDIILFESGAIGSLNLIKLILKGHLPVPIQVVESSIGCVEAVRIMSDGAYVGAADNLRCGDDSAIGY
ncbi:gamma-glutamyltransferase, partial [bacterium]|nr:gamma-glutamyltransferase [bacterium]